MFDSFGTTPQVRKSAFGSYLYGLVCKMNNGMLQGLTIKESCPFDEIRISDYCLGVSALFKTRFRNFKRSPVKLIFDNTLVYEQDCFVDFYPNVQIDMSEIEDDNLVERLYLEIFRSDSTSYEYFVSNIIDQPDRKPYMLWKLLINGVFMSEINYLPLAYLKDMQAKFKTRIEGFIRDTLAKIKSFDYRNTFSKQGFKEMLDYMDDISRSELLRGGLRGYCKVFYILYANTFRATYYDFKLYRDLCQMGFWDRLF